MGSTLFSGAVRSEGGFEVVTKNATTGAITTNAVWDTGSSPMTAGTGITTGTGTIYVASISKSGTLIHTQIFIDLTGLNSGGGAGDIIGVDATANSHLGQITAAVNGTIVGASVTCLEAPTGGDPDIDVYSAVEATGTEDAAITGLDETQLVNTGDHTLGAVNVFTAFPAADEYLYLVAGAITDATYTAGKLLIDLYGYDA